jgi:protein-S-isoprenylcysteine O-methyltransferase Ste14
MTQALVHFVERHRILVSRLFVAAFFGALWVCEPALEGSLAATALFLAGLVLVATATVGRLWCSLYISGNKDSELVTVGPYSVTRNPLYLFSFVGFVGIGLATETLTFALALAAFFALVYPFIIAAEERVLAARFGEAFEAYRARTPRFIPRWSNYVEPRTWSVDTRLFRRTMRDVVWFVWIVGVIELVEALHEHGMVIARIAVP